MMGGNGGPPPYPSASNTMTSRPYDFNPAGPPTTDYSSAQLSHLPDSTSTPLDPLNAMEKSLNEQVSKNAV